MFRTGHSVTEVPLITLYHPWCWLHPHFSMTHSSNKGPAVYYYLDNPIVRAVHGPQEPFSVLHCYNLDISVPSTQRSNYGGHSGASLSFTSPSGVKSHELRRPPYPSAALFWMGFCFDLFQGIFWFPCRSSSLLQFSRIIETQWPRRPTWLFFSCVGWHWRHLSEISCRTFYSHTTIFRPSSSGAEFSRTQPSASGGSPSYYLPSGSFLWTSPREPQRLLWLLMITCSQSFSTTSRSLRPAPDSWIIPHSFAFRQTFAPSSSSHCPWTTIGECPLTPISLTIVESLKCSLKPSWAPGAQVGTHSVVLARYTRSTQPSLDLAGQ